MTMQKIKNLVFFCSLFLITSPCIANLKIGTVLFDPPYVMSINQGFDIDLIHKICERTHNTCQLIPMDFNKLFSTLIEEKIDLAIGGISISENRETNIIYSLPYMVSKGSFLIRQNNPIQSIQDLQGKKVGVIRGQQEDGVFYNFLNDSFPGQFTIEQYNNVEDIINALTNQQIDAAFLHESTALYWVLNSGGDQFKIFGKPSIVGEGVAIMAAKKNQSLINIINQQLKEIEKDGTYIKLYQTYFGNEL